MVYLKANELRSIREKLFKEELPYRKPRQIKRLSIHKSSLVNAWCIPYMGCDLPILQRSQRFFHECENKQPIQVQTYAQFQYDKL